MRSASAIRISINVTNYSWNAPAVLAAELRQIARHADQAGLDTLWVADHLLQADPNSTPDAAMLEAYTTLGYLAGHTAQIRLGIMVSAVTYRAPALLIKAATTLDVLSGGRAWLGLGAGYQQQEARAMGLPLPTVAERFERLEEVLLLAEQMFRGDEAPFEGRHYELAGPIGSPRPLTRPRPPILIGGMGERKTLRLVARYADGCNLFDVPDGGATIRHKLHVLRRHCAELGRSYESIDKTVSARFDPCESVSGFSARCADLAELGIEHVVALTTGPWTSRCIDTLGAVRGAVAGR